MALRFGPQTWIVLLACIAALGLSPFAWRVAANAADTPGVQLVMLEEDGCAWCAKWNADIGVVYGKTPEGKQAPLRRVDIHDPLPDDLKFLKTGNYTPTFVLVSAGKEVGRIRGYPGEDFFWPFLNQLLERLNSDKSNSSLVVN